MPVVWEWSRAGEVGCLSICVEQMCELRSYPPILVLVCLFASVWPLREKEGVEALMTGRG